MKPIVVMDQDVVATREAGTVVAELLTRNGYLGIAAQVGSRVQVFYPPAASRLSWWSLWERRGARTRRPLLISDADSGIDVGACEAAGYLVQRVKPGSRVWVLGG